MRVLRFAGVLLMALVAATAARAEFGTVEIAASSEALTFARAGDGAQARLILVSAYADGKVSGIDVTAAAGSDDPITAYRAHGYDGLAALNGDSIEVALAALTLPARLGASHVAAGTNFPEHGKEATVTDGPFLFPKEVAPTAFDAPVPAGDALLDYEVELCFVALETFDLEAAPEHMGLVLCNDVTDRAALMRHVDPDDVTSGKGFTTGKSAPGFLPVGNLFVIPRELRRFADAVELRLWRNGELKQSAVQSEAIWDFDELLRQTKVRETTQWEYDERMAGLPVTDGALPERAMILAGTPDGTVFKGVNKSAMALGAWDFIAGGWDRKLTAHVVERHIAQERAAGNYLQPGERVQISVRFLGEIDSRVVE
jgi:2-keto-4-pentenoate hydratase/2-oxohepta-3-ene-1,7-dioic acid hydratase in catechol pathway